MDKKTARILNVLEKAVDLIEKCGGPGGKPGPCPMNKPEAKPSTPEGALQRVSGVHESLTFSSDTHRRLPGAEAKSLTPKGIKTRVDSSFGGVLKTKNSIEEIQTAFIGAG